MKNDYDSSGIQIIRGLDAVRKRPGLYVGDTDDGTGLQHLLWEIFSNSLDQFLARKCTKVVINICTDNSVEVIDDGEGIPIREINGTPFLEAFMTELHTTATFDGHTPHTHVGSPIGLGAAVVNALSSRVEVNIYRDGYHWSQDYTNGKPSRFIQHGPTEKSGTSFKFQPDPSVFSNLKFDKIEIEKRLNELAKLNKGLNIQFNYQTMKSVEICSNKGLEEFFIDPLAVETEDPAPVISGKGEYNGITVDLAFCWHRGSNTLRSFANQLCTSDGGSHVKGLLSGIAAGMMKLEKTDLDPFKFENKIKKDLSVVVNVNIANPKFSGPTKDRLINPEAQEAVYKVAERIAYNYFRCV